MVVRRLPDICSGYLSLFAGSLTWLPRKLRVTSKYVWKSPTRTCAQTNWFYAMAARPGRWQNFLNHALYSFCRSTVAMVNITVLPGNLHPPKFPDGPHSAIINEAVAVGTIVTQVQVRKMSLPRVVIHSDFGSCKKKNKKNWKFDPARIQLWWCPLDPPELFVFCLPTGQ